MTDPTPLSPAAQVVLDAYIAGLASKRRLAIAAALRAAAARAIRWPEHYEGLGPSAYDDGWNEALDYIMAIATELENNG